MGILDRITGKKPASGKSTVKKEVKPKAIKKAPNQENVLDMVQEPVAAVDEKKAVVLKTDTGRAHHILHNYHLSEKSNLMSATGRYVFKVSKAANKLEVKKAVENVYDVHVTDVNMVTAKGKIRRSGRVTGKTSDWKKAYVTLKNGEKISGLAEGV
jgi:large subunit ribosomal protein L23